MTRFALLFAGAALSFTATQAGAQDSRIIKSVTEKDLEALVLAEGDTIDAKHPFEAPSVRGKTEDGLVYLLIGTACDAQGVPGCQGIMMQVRYDEDAKVTWEKLGKANLNEAALSSWWDQEDNTVGFTRYVVLDDGVTWMNLRRNLRVLLAIQDNTYGHVFD